MKRTYHRTEDRRNFYKQRLEEQGSRCAICGKEERLVVDHDRRNGNLRGLLCYDHYRGLRMFQDSSQLLRQAIEYLGSFPDDVIEQLPSFKVTNDPIIKATNELLEESSFKTDSERAKELAKRFNLSFSAAQSRISRARKLGNLPRLHEISVENA